MVQHFLVSSEKNSTARIDCDGMDFVRISAKLPYQGLDGSNDLKVAVTSITGDGKRKNVG